MFRNKQLLMVQHIEAWPKDQLSIILSYLAHPHPTSCLVMTTPKKKGLEKLVSAVDSVGAVVQFAALTEKEAPRWLMERARSRNKMLTPQAADSFLVEQVGVRILIGPSTPAEAGSVRVTPIGALQEMNGRSPPGTMSQVPEAILGLEKSPSEAASSSFA